MSAPVTAAKFLAALKAEGLTVIEVGSWRTHNRNSKGPWGPVHGTMIHHTVTRGSANTVRICRDGYAELPGPLCHGVITKDGRVHLVGYGRTNHAGGGDPDTLAAVIAENYGNTPPTPNVGNSDGVDGNRHFYGFECENMGDGEDPWPAPQLEAIERVSAAVCRLFGWTAKSVIGHKEWSDDKSDPRGFSMVDMRARVQARLDGHDNGGGTDPDPGGEVPTDPNAYPGADKFGPGKSNEYIIRLGRMLVARGGGRFYSEGPGPSWGDADKNATAAFQRAQGWTGGDADGIPGSLTWGMLVSGTGNNIPSAKPAVSASRVAAAARRDPGLSQGGTTHPDDVAPVKLALVRIGLLSGPYSGGGYFGSTTRTAYSEFQRSLGYRGTDADGVPGKSSLSVLAARTGLFTVTN
jgi:hypothetical protein